jgi:hypothetical protein
MGNYLDTPMKKNVCAAGLAFVAGCSLVYLSRRRQQPIRSVRKTKYLEILDREALAAILREVRKQYSTKFTEVRRLNRLKRRALDIESEFYRNLVIAFNDSIPKMFEEARDQVLKSYDVDSQLLLNSVNYYEGNDDLIVELAHDASKPINNA